MYNSKWSIEFRYKTVTIPVTHCDSKKYGFYDKGEILSQYIIKL